MRIRNAVVEWYLAKAAVTLTHCLFATVRKRFQHFNEKSSPYVPPQDGTFIYCVWHDSLMMPLFMGAQPATIALVGMHRDGTFLADSLKLLGIGCVRGSSSRGGGSAVRELLEISRLHHIVLTPDGPRGPRRQMKPGVAFLASRTGKPVIPTAFACRRAWSIGTGWTDLAIPKPWTTVFALTGEGIHVPANATREELEQHTQKIQDEMDLLNAAALKIAQ